MKEIGLVLALMLMGALTPTARAATISATLSPLKKNTAVYSWVAVTENDTFAAVEPGDAADLSIQIVGTFGSATVLVQGSNDDGVTWATLNDLGGTAISKTQAALVGIREKVKQIRLSASGGSSQSLKAYLFVRGR